MIKKLRGLSRCSAGILAATAYGILASVLFAGCGHPEPDPSPPVESLWQASAIMADGRGEDWEQVPPLYYDRETRTGIWAANDETRLSLLVSVSSEDSARRLERSGVVLILKTGEEGAGPFRLVLKGQGGPGMGRPDRGGPPPSPPGAAGVEDSPEKSESRPPGLKLPETVTVSYPYGSDDMTMSLDEAEGNGISLGLGSMGSGSWIFEAVIRLDAVYFNAPPLDGSCLTLSIACLDTGRGTGAPGNDGGQNGPPGPGRGGPPSGGPPGGGSGPGPAGGRSGPSHKGNTSFNPSVSIILSSPPRG